MRLIRPYGRSRTTDKTRVLMEKIRPNAEAERSIADFAASNADILIAQWISCLDKIIRKPGKSGEYPTAEQRKQRQNLADAMWPHLGLSDDRHQAKWMAKVHPYGPNNHSDDGKKTQSGERIQGRWYSRFVDTTPINYRRVALAVHDHLHHHALGRHPLGMIKHRANSVEKNTLKPNAQGVTLQESAWKAYKADALMRDITEKQRQANDAARNSRHWDGKPARLTWPAVAICLYNHYPRIFDVDIPVAEQADNPLFHIHQAVKDYWRRLLKESKYSGEKLATIQPKTKEQLQAVVMARQENRQRMATTRRGKIIHYHTMVPHDGRPPCWPSEDDWKTSRFWDSDGQTEIKLDEALVRIWRRVLALAQRSLTDWVDSGERDVLSAPPPETFDQDKTALLFGPRSPIGNGYNPAARAREVLSQLRNSTFHFTRLDQFLDTLQQNKEQNKKNEEQEKRNKIAKPAEEQFWYDDNQLASTLVPRMLEGVEACHYLSPTLLDPVMEQSGGGAGLLQRLPLPRFNRCVARGAATLGRDFPLQPVNRQKMEDDPALRCRYVVLKLLYETGFRHWLDQDGGPHLAQAIRDATDRTSRAAQTINGANCGEHALITARAAKMMDGGGPYQTLADFMARLNRETASEMRVQAGYSHDAAQARAQMEFIDDLLCDVLARLLVIYLNQTGLSALGQAFHRRDLPSRMPDPPASTLPPKPWVPSLYMIMHLVPVDDVGQLLHQLRRWITAHAEFRAKTVPAAKKRTVELVDAVIHILTLYLNCHDAKFSGGSSGNGIRWTVWETLFDSKTTFDRVFPTQTGGTHLPLRGLREVQRFGDFAPLRHCFRPQDKITTQMVDDWKKQTELMPEKQRLREELHREIANDHQRWKKKPRQQKCTDLRDYADLVNQIARHRHLTARITQADVVRLHRLMMAVLARLLDYSGLWERDLYFATLETMTDAAYQKIKDNEKLLELLSSGQIIKFTNSAKEKNFTEFYGMSEIINKKTITAKMHRYIRNDFAHFNMLKSSQTPNLTDAINQARDLMGYDRKLKNAITRSITELLAREGLDIRWTMNDQHHLTLCGLTVRRATHLAQVRWNDFDITPPQDDLLGDHFRQWVWILFGGTDPAPQHHR